MSASKHETAEQTRIQQWCSQAAAGQVEALEKLIWSYRDRLMGYTVRRIGVDWRGKIEPTDVLQDALIDIYHQIGGFSARDGESFYRWATTIIQHKLIDHMRRLRRAKRDVARERSTTPSGAGYDSLIQRCLQESATASRALRRQDAVSALMTCMARLPEDQRTVVRKLYLAEESLARVAEDMNRSTDAVRRLASRAVARLSECLGRASRYLSTHG